MPPRNVPQVTSGQASFTPTTIATRGSTAHARGFRPFGDRRGSAHRRQSRADRDRGPAVGAVVTPLNVRSVHASRKNRAHKASGRPGVRSPGRAKIPGAAPSRDRYRPRNAPPGRCAGARAPAVRAGVSRGDAPPHRRPGRRRGRARRQRGRRRGRQVAARSGASTRSTTTPASLCFGRIDDDADERWYIGRRHVEDTRRHAGGRRLARRGRHALLPGHARRSARACTCAAGSCSTAASSATCSRRTSTIPTRSRARAACPIRCSPSSGAPAPARCATSSRRSRASRTRSSARRSRPASSCRAGRARARRRSGCTAPRSCCTSTARASRVAECWWSARTRCSCATSARCSRRSARRRPRRRRSTACSACGSGSSPTTPTTTAAVKGDARMAAVIERAAADAIRIPADGIVLELPGPRRSAVTAAELEAMVAAVRSRAVPVERAAGAIPARARAPRVRGVHPRYPARLRRGGARRGALRRRGVAQGDRRLLALGRRGRGRPVAAHPARRAGPRGRRACSTPTEQELLLRPRAEADAWTAHDLPLLDEAEALLKGGTRQYEHVVVDEAQDLSPMQLRHARPPGPPALDDRARRPRPGHRSRLARELGGDARAPRPPRERAGRGAHDGLPAAGRGALPREPAARARRAGHRAVTFGAPRRRPSRPAPRRRPRPRRPGRRPRDRAGRRSRDGGGDRDARTRRRSCGPRSRRAA